MFNSSQNHVLTVFFNLLPYFALYIGGASFFRVSIISYIVWYTLLWIYAYFMKNKTFLSSLQRLSYYWWSKISYFRNSVSKVFIKTKLLPFVSHKNSQDEENTGIASRFGSVLSLKSYLSILFIFKFFCVFPLSRYNLINVNWMHKTNSLLFVLTSFY